MVRLDTTLPQSSSPAVQPQVDAEWPEGVTPPPTHLYSDEPPLETDFHRDQIDLLIRLLKYWWRDRNDFYISGNLTVYYSAEQTKKRDFRGPDIFVVMDTEKRDRRSWTIWEENGKYPNIVIELLSNSTAAVDKGVKKELYQNVWRLPEYYWFHPETMEFAGFRLTGSQYEAIAPNPDGHLTCQELGLELGIYEQSLRWFTSEGKLIPLPEEAEQQAREQAEDARQQAEQQANQERKKRERLEEYLRSQGIDPDQLPS